MKILLIALQAEGCMKWFQSKPFEVITELLNPRLVADGGVWIGTARMRIRGVFTALPVNLTFGLNNLPIVFTAGSNTLNNAAGATGFTPGSGTSTSLSGTGALFVFVGGTVSPASNLAAGTYTGTVTMQVLY